MSAHRAAVLVGLLVASAVLAGCASSTAPEPASLAAFQWEEAKYEVQEGNGTVVGTAAVNLTLRGDRFLVEAYFSPFSGQGSYISGMADANTGERLYLQDADWRRYFYGPSLSFPNAAFSALMGPGISADAGAPLDDLLFMVGPQWLVMREAPPQEIQVNVSQGSDGMRLVTQAPCPLHCPSNMDVTLVNDWLMAGGLLPATGHHYSTHEPEGGVWFVRTDHRVGPPADLQMQAPPERFLPERQPLCDGLPCEPEDWPRHLSVTRIRDMVESTPEWGAYKAAHPDATNDYVVAGSGGTYLLEDIQVAQTEYGSAYYRVEDHGRDGFGVGQKKVAGAALPFVPTATQFHTPWHQAMTMTAPPEQTLALDEVTMQLLDAFGMKLEDVTALSIRYGPEGLPSDDPERARLGIIFAGGDEMPRVIRASAVDGSVFVASRNLPQLPEDPNRGGAS